MKARVKVLCIILTCMLVLIYEYSLLSIDVFCFFKSRPREMVSKQKSAANRARLPALLYCHCLAPVASGRCILACVCSVSVSHVGSAVRSSLPRAGRSRIPPASSQLARRLALSWGPQAGARSTVTSTAWQEDREAERAGTCLHNCTLSTQGSSSRLPPFLRGCIVLDLIAPTLLHLFSSPFPHPP
jgi:hypothetical protein